MESRPQIQNRAHVRCPREPRPKRNFWGCQDGAAVMAWQPRSRRSYGIHGKVWQPHDTEPVIRAGPSQVDSGAGQTWPFAHVSDPRHNVSTSISTTDTPLPLGRRRSVAMPREPERSGRHAWCPREPRTKRKFWGCQDGAAVMAWQPRSRRPYGLLEMVWSSHDTEPVIMARSRQVGSGAGQTSPLR